MKLNLLFGVAVATAFGLQLQAQGLGTYTTTCTPIGLQTRLIQAGEDLQGNDITVDANVEAKPSNANAMIMDIWYLDNSFNIQLNNGSPIFDSELQFQTGQIPPQNVSFVSGGSYENGAAPIWDLGSSNLNTPGPTVVTVILKNDGSVSLFGIKQNGAPLEALQLSGVGTNFNASLLNGNSPINVLVSQSIVAQTVFAANVYWADTSTCMPGLLGTNEVNFQDFVFNSVVKGQLQMKSSKSIQTVKIYNMSGQMVRALQPNSAQPVVNLQDLQPGIYMMNVTINGTTKAYKMVKQ